MPVEPAREVVAAPARRLSERLIARLKTLKGAIVAIAGVGAVLGGLAGYWNAYQAARASTESSKLLALVGKGDAGPLSIVVLPFANLTGDPRPTWPMGSPPRSRPTCRASAMRSSSARRPRLPTRISR